MNRLINFYNNYENCERYRQRYNQSGGTTAQVASHLMLNLNKRKSFKKQVLLDLGCGPGSSIRPFTQFSFSEYVGIDCSNIMLDMAKEVAKEEKITLTTLQADLTKSKIDLSDNSVGMAISFACMTYLPNCIELIHEMHRVLRPGGMLCCAMQITSQPLKNGPVPDLFKNLVHIPYVYWTKDLIRTSKKLKLKEESVYPLVTDIFMDLNEEPIIATHSLIIFQKTV